MANPYRYTDEEAEKLAHERAERFNSLKPLPPGDYDPCSICNNWRNVAIVKGSGNNANISFAPCACTALMKQKDAIKASQMEQLLQVCGFGNFLTPEPWQRKLLEKVIACSEDEEGRWLLLCGQSGCGKTHLAAALCRVLLAREQKPLYMSWPGQIRSICAACFDHERREQLLRPYRVAQVLLLDDLFKTRLGADGVPEVSRQELDVAFELIDHRVRENKRTIITSEVSTAKLMKLSEALTGRILEKAGPFVQTITSADGRNWRIKSA